MTTMNTTTTTGAPGTHDIATMRAAHEVLAEFSFEPAELERGYAGRTLRIDIEKGEFRIDPVTQQMKDLWIGGKGFDLWLMLQEVKRGTRWDNPANPLCFASGPLGGVTSVSGAGKTIVTSLSPLTDSVMDCNVGGYFGPFLKFTGFDGLVVTGKIPKEHGDVIIFIDGDARCVTIERAPLESVDAHVLSEELTEMYAEDELDKRNISVVSAGRAAEFTRMGVLNFSFYDWRRQVARLKQAGRGGVGTVLRDKGIKAIAIKRKNVTPAWSVEESPVASLVTPKKLDPAKASSCGDCAKDEQAELRAIISRWNDDPDYVIEMMQDIQDRERYISKNSIDTLCAVTGVPKAHLYHIATFYKAFSLEPRGETVIQVCVGTACHVKGAARIADELERQLGMSRGETSADGRYTLEEVACLGACSIAPVVKFGDEIVGNVQAQDVRKLLKNMEKSRSAEQDLAEKGGAS
jgi:NADH:ubiquinone oxidoreductase subunit E